MQAEPFPEPSWNPEVPEILSPFEGSQGVLGDVLLPRVAPLSSPVL